MHSSEKVVLIATLKLNCHKQMDLLTLGVKSIGTLKEVIVSTIRVQVHLFPSVGKHNQQVAFHGKSNIVLQAN